jgi:16S rRNA (uracil1498-N3)-methyltransferase
MICKIIEKREDSFSAKVEIHAGIGLLKNDKMELVIQKLVEIGVSKIIPIQMQRTIVKINEKKEKWDVIAKEALKQCQAVKLTEISEPKTLKQIDYSEYDLVLVPYENESEIRI